MNNMKQIKELIEFTTRLAAETNCVIDIEMTHTIYGQIIVNVKPKDEDAVSEYNGLGFANQKSA